MFWFCVISRLFKVTILRKPACEFLLLNNINLHPISYRCQVVGGLCITLWLSTGDTSLFNALVWGEHLNSGGQKKKTRNTSLYRVVRKAFRYLEPPRRESRVWQTDRQIDRQIAIARSNIVRHALKRHSISLWWNLSILYGCQRLCQCQIKFIQYSALVFTTMCHINLLWRVFVKRLMACMHQ